jgi:peptide/nickel transport system substrate-binding protein
MPEGPGYRIVFAHLRRDWRAIGIDAVRVRPEAAAELRLIDAVVPAVLATWYLRHFSCDAARV